MAYTAHKYFRAVQGLFRVFPSEDNSLRLPGLKSVSMGVLGRERCNPTDPKTAQLRQIHHRGKNVPRNRRSVRLGRRKCKGLRLLPPSGWSQALAWRVVRACPGSRFLSHAPTLLWHLCFRNLCGSHGNHLTERSRVILGGRP